MKKPSRRILLYSKEEFIRLILSFFIEGVFVSVTSFFKLKGMLLLFYISIGITVVLGLLIVAHLIYRGVVESRKKYEKDTSEILRMSSIINMYRAEKLYQGEYKGGDIYNSRIAPAIEKERNEIQKILDDLMPQLTGTRKKELLSMFYELNPDQRNPAQ